MDERSHIPFLQKANTINSWFEYVSLKACWKTLWTYYGWTDTSTALFLSKAINKFTSAFIAAIILKISFLHATTSLVSMKFWSLSAPQSVFRKSGCQNSNTRFENEQQKSCSLYSEIAAVCSGISLGISLHTDSHYLMIEFGGGGRTLNVKSTSQSRGRFLPRSCSSLCQASHSALSVNLCRLLSHPEPLPHLINFRKVTAWACDFRIRWLAEEGIFTWEMSPWIRNMLWRAGQTHSIVGVAQDSTWHRRK